MDLIRFQNSLSGRLLQFGEGEAAYWAFIPNPLPPSLQLDTELVCALSEADRAIGELAGLGRTMANPQLLIGPFIRREAVLSSRIEGTQADLRDLYAYEAGQIVPSSMKPTPAESDVREVHNYVRAMEYGLERIKTLPINEMNVALNFFEKYLHEGNEYPPLVRLALIHYQFEAIHPFLDGNGRIGRLLISLLLVHWNLLPLPLLLRLIDSLFDSPVLTIPIAKQLLNVTYLSAQRNVEKLVKVNILRPWEKTSYGKVFFAEKILRITGELES